MSETKFTPGPWTTEDFNTQRFAVYAPNGRICQMDITRDSQRAEEGQANAHLIAAAPELYEALREVLSAYVPGWDGAEYSDVGGSVSHARAALAKARGEAA